MISLDTNILIYAVNQDCEEHDRARAVYQEMLSRPSEWIISDQVLFEFYRALRNPKIFEFPLTHTEALHQITFLREETGVLHCAYEHRLWETFMKPFQNSQPKSVQIFDYVLATTLLANGVNTFYTRNIKDFKRFSFKELVNPVD
ncbi:MAG: PIN domain-containing protein [Verrucomicrobia bacterium]|nr:PIN domain-containing protein [Verrucomicrobiota bacterium]MCH8526048.1 PIN domain-containing protein [Kiritimatiellia bacterium]